MGGRAKERWKMILEEGDRRIAGFSRVPTSLDLARGEFRVGTSYTIPKASNVPRV